jgi:hypothetical protein
MESVRARDRFGRALATVLVGLAMPAIGLADSEARVGIAEFRYLETVVVFYRVLLQDRAPTVAEYRKVFGPHDESELVLVLQTVFGIDPTDPEWDERNDVIEYLKKMDEEPDRVPSLFWKCLRLHRKEFLVDSAKAQIALFPERVGDFTYHTVTAGKRSIRFAFSKGEYAIESIRLVDGRVVYELLRACGR